ncbi:MAG: LysM peptidoglycan-binding domain-containing protein [Propionibacteriaceae bacterium]|nr:LysM peptidoglycan-binding domain-containing protein [Propionibacteriaceae bacterium]
MTVTRSIVAWVVLALLVFGVPWVVVEWGYWAEVRTLIQDPSLFLLPDDGHVVLAIVTVLAALFWVQLAWSVLAEMVVAVRRRRRGRARAARCGDPVRARTTTRTGPAGPLGLTRALVRPLVSAAFALSIAGGALSAVADSPANTVSVVAPAWPDDSSAITSAPTPVTVGIPGPQTMTATAPDAGGMYTVAPGDSLWSIAERFLGDGHQWTSIAAENEELVQDAPDLIHVGWKLRIPVVGLPDRGDTPCQPDHVAVVAPGDSLWSIAEREMGGGSLWPALADANAPLVADPFILQPGEKLTIPCTAPVGGGPAAESLLATAPEEDTPEVATTPVEPTPGASGEDLGFAWSPVEDEGASTSASPPPASTATSPASDERQAPSPAPIESVDEPSAGADAQGLVRDIGISTFLAGGLVLLIGRRRLNQLRTRPVGRRILLPNDEGHRLESALGVVGSRFIPGGAPYEGRECAARRAIGGFSDEQSIDDLLLSAEGVPLCVGTTTTGDAVHTDITEAKPFLVFGAQADQVRSVMRGIAMNITLSDYSDSMELHVLDGQNLFDTFDSVTRHATLADAIECLRLVITERRTYLGDSRWTQLRNDPDYAEAWRPVLYCLIDPVDARELRELADCLDGSDVGVAVLAGMYGPDLSPSRAIASGSLRVEGIDHAVLDPGHRPVAPFHLDVSEPLANLLQTSASPSTTPAWWSSSTSAEPDLPDPWTPPHDRTAERGFAMTPVPTPDAETSLAATFSHPTLKILGPVLLEGAQGPPPPRAERACMEYCGWLLEHPGATAMAMAQGLLVAEGTRRSNMSRLRTWLGNDAQGEPYLPEAYSGRIWLDPAVTSDWQRLRLLIASGVEATSTDKLIQALHLVRGAPLADAAPGQWHWAEELRTDIVSVIRDIGVIATARCLQQQDIDRARWAASRALIAAPEDEQLLCARVRTEHAAGNRMEVERLVNWISRNARNLGTDLLPETVTTLHEVIGSRPTPPVWPQLARQGTQGLSDPG